MADVTFKYKVQLSVGVWTDISDDALQNVSTSAKRGVDGNGPMDCVAGTGQCQYTLRNDGDRPGKAMGRYSPVNAACLAGWTFGIPFKLVAVYLGVEYTRFTGKLRVIYPDSGVNEKLQVLVTAYDVMRDLAETDIREIGIQLNQTEAEIVTNVLAALPTASQPIATDIDFGVDTYPYALDDIGVSVKALSVIADAARSAFSFVAVKGDGTLIMRSRHTRALAASLYTFADDAEALDVPADLEGVYNLVRVTIHPKTIDAAATTVLYALTGAVPVVQVGTPLTIWGDYNDPTNAQKLIGGTAVVTALVAYPTASYDYAGNSAIDGTGSDQTANLSIVATAFASTVKLVVTNNGAVPIYLVAPSTTVPMLRVRGKGVYDRGPQTFEAMTVQDYGTRSLEIDMPYQDDPDIGQSAATFVENQYDSLTRQARSLVFKANKSHDKMLCALQVEPGDRITVSETVTGLVLVEANVQSVADDIIENVWTCTLGLAPADTFAFWQLGIAGASELGETTVLGF